MRAERPVSDPARDERFMREALALAREAAAEGEVPVGAVVVRGDEIVGRGRNRRETGKTALAHAELEAIGEACRTLGGCPTGQAKITGGYRLPARYVIHTPGPIWHGGQSGEDDLLADCYRSCLALAAEHDCRTVAFPAISTGVYHFPLDRAAAIAVREIRAFLQTHAVPERVLLVCFDARTAQAYENALN